ncbi:hypothetical protein V8E36_009978 [Tilletia maclaganii]
MTSLDPSLALDLRLRLLEAIVTGAYDRPFQAARSNQEFHIPSSRTLSARTSRVTQILHSTVKENGSLTSFVKAYDKNLPFLNPAFALSQPGSNPVEDDLLDGEHSSSSTAPDITEPPLSALALPPQAQAALLLEVEPDLHELERQLTECKILEERGSAGPGTLSESASLAPRLDAAWKQHEARRQATEALEKQLSTLCDSYTDYTDAASQVFVAWDEMLTAIEFRIAREEKTRLQDL